MELLYNIKRDKINYIHGKRNCNQKLVVGHINSLNGDDFLSKEPMIYEYEAYDNIAKVVNKQKKDISKIIQDNAKYRDSLATIDKIVIYGHSLSDIDYDYFVNITKHIKLNAQWFFSVYYNNDKEYIIEYERVEKFANKLKLAHSNWTVFSM